MTSNNKILTVSYGTFSCTLEGFEDSFETMKTIAEYFRDLAQEDRYFGAEPPQPDANLLARIAEKEIARHVDAQADENGIHLRAVTPVLAAAAPLPTTTPDADVAELAEIVTADSTEDTATDDASTSQEAEAKNAPTIEEADEQAKDAINTEVAVADTEVSEDNDLNVNASSMLALMSQQDDTGTIDEPGDLEALNEDPNETFSDISESATLVAEIVEEPEVADSTADTSIASRLQAIRAVVAKSDDAPSGYSEDQHAEELASEVDSDIEAVFENDVDITSVDEVDEAEEIAEDQDIDATIASALADFSDEAVAETPDVADEPANTVESRFSKEEADSLAELIPEIDALDGLELAQEEENVALDLEVTGADLGEASQDSGAEMSDELVEIDAEDLTELESVLNLDEINLVEPQTGAEDATPAGRVIMVKKSDLEAALENGMLEEIDETISDSELGDVSDLAGNIDVTPEPASDEAGGSETELAPDSSLSDEDEADLMRELEAVESEFHEDLVDDAAIEEDDSAHDATARFQELSGTEEDELDRLMAEADNQMEEPEGKDRRSAFSHLRGAVVATKSDDKLSEEAAGTIENEDDYRTDLAAAVRPRRPVSSGGSARPQAERPAPLKLVAAQRIDETSEVAAAPVRPRRVEATESSSVDAASGSFSEYVEAQGARELSELLEAAASYLSFVEGRDQFSRPQLMTKVRQVGHEEFTREAGLRSFGQLLRSGKIEKIKGGRFTVSQEIGFRPEERQAG